MSVIKDAAGELSLLRIALPGAVATVAVHPLVDAWLAPVTRRRFEMDTLLLVAIEVLVLGLVLNLLSRDIVMVYEGFRFPWLTNWLQSFQEKRIERLQRKLFQAGQGENSIDLAEQMTSDLLRDYPNRVNEEDEGVEWYAERPTLLGNIIAAFELYPETRYGISGVSFWHHLLALSPEPARKDFTDRINVAEALILASAAGFFVCAVYLFLSFALLVGNFVPEMILGRSPVGAREAVVGLVLAAVAYWCFYKLAMPAYREAGCSFRALTDLTIPSLRDWMSSAQQHLATDLSRHQAMCLEQALAFSLRVDVNEASLTPSETDEERASPH